MGDAGGDDSSAGSFDEAVSLILQNKEELDLSYEWGEREWTRIGALLGQNRSLNELCLHHCDVNFPALCAGLQSNRHIKYLYLKRIGLQDPDKMKALVPFLVRCPSLEYISIDQHPSSSIDVLARALSSRKVDTLERLILNGDDYILSGVDLDVLAMALSQLKSLVDLTIGYWDLGTRGCKSLAKLLSNSNSNLKEMNIHDELIDDECLGVLANGLAKNKNTKLEALRLGAIYNRITEDGWEIMSQLVCNTSSIDSLIESNHTLNNVGGFTYWFADFLEESLQMNNAENKVQVAREKIIMCMLEERISLGDSSIAIGAVPDALAYLDSHLRLAGEYETTRLGLMYHNIRSMPSIVADCFPKEKMSALRQENDELRDENARLRRKIQDLEKKLQVASMIDLPVASPGVHPVTFMSMLVVNAVKVLRWLLRSCTTAQVPSSTP